MTPERLEEIRERLVNHFSLFHVDVVHDAVAQDVRELLAEVDRLTRENRERKELLERSAKILAWHSGRLSVVLSAERECAGTEWHNKGQAKLDETHAILKAIDVTH